MRSFDEEKKEEKKADAKDEVHEPEKVHVLQPLAYQERANTNFPNKRTTFYS